MKKYINPLAVGFTLIAAVAIAADANSPLLNLLLMGDGLHSNDWGIQTNNNLTKVENAIAGRVAYTLTGNKTLTQAESAYASLYFAGTPAAPATVTLPSLSRLYSIGNATGKTLTIKCGAGNATTLSANTYQMVGCDNYANAYNMQTPTTDDSVPIGTMLSFAGASAPNANYMLCDGSAILRATYATLFSLIGVTYGSGNGTTSFNIPDVRGRFLSMYDGGTGRLNSWNRGATGGGANTTLVTGNLPAHNHPVTDPGHNHAVTDPGHVHALGGSSGIFANGSYAGLYIGQTPSLNSASATTGISIGTRVTGITTGNTGSGTSFTNVPPTVVVGCIIRVQ